MNSIIDYVYETTLARENTESVNEAARDEEIDLYNQLQKLLSPQQFNLFKKYVDAINQQLCTLSQGMFRCGFQKGALLMLELFDSHPETP